MIAPTTAPTDEPTVVPRGVYMIEDVPSEETSAPSRSSDGEHEMCMWFSSADDDSSTPPLPSYCVEATTKRRDALETFKYLGKEHYWCDKHEVDYAIGGQCEHCQREECTNEPEIKRHHDPNMCYSKPSPRKKTARRQPGTKHYPETCRWNLTEGKRDDQSTAGTYRTFTEYVCTLDRSDIEPGVRPRCKPEAELQGDAHTAQPQPDVLTSPTHNHRQRRQSKQQET